MLKCVLNGEQLAKTMLNDSKSNKHYSFSKANRFKSNDNKARNTNFQFYKLPDVSSKRSTSFGFGKKTDFTKLNNKNNPSPCDYNINTSLLFKNKSLSFGLKLV